MAIYKGFSTIGRNKKFQLTDFELAKQDLINHLHIKKGEKLMNPDFGTIVWSLLFEPLTEELKAVIKDDLTRVVSYDPRLQIDNMILGETPGGHGITLAIDLTYINSDQRDTIYFNFTRPTV